MTIEDSPPPAASRLDRLRAGGLLFFLLAATVGNFLILRDYVFEDAYITFRYAANLAAGQGFVFQPGERVLGSSTPLYALLLAACGALGADIPAAGKLIFSLSLSACAFFGWRLLARRGAINAGAVFAVAAVSGAGGILPFAGMETGLHLALIFLAFLLSSEKKPWSTGLVLGLVCLDRYDGVMAAAAVLLVRRLATRRWPWREAGLAGTIFGGWLLFARLYFGSFLPNSYAAKAADVSFSEYSLASLEQQARQLLLPLHWAAPATAKNLFLWPALTLLFLPLLWRAGARLATLVRRREQAPDPAGGGLDLAAPAFFAFSLWLGYSSIGPPLGHTWYLIPATYSVLLLGLAAWGLLPVPAPAARGAALGLIFASLLLLPWAKRGQAALMSSVVFGSDRLRAYENIARFVRRHGFENTSVLTLEPGYLTYLSGQRAIDAAGLVSPGVFFHGPREQRDDFFELLARFRPETAVLSLPLPGEPEPGERSYLHVLTPAPGRSLWMRRDVYEGHFEKLYESWQRGEYGQYPETSRRHALAVDFGGPDSSLFFLRRSRLQKVRGLTFEGQSYRQRVLTSRGGAGEAAAWSEPFLIDFDELEFLFAASHGSATVARLYVEGLPAFELAGNNAPAGPEAIAPLEKIGLPVHGWRGRHAMLMFVSAEAREFFFAADLIRSRRWARQKAFDDFESGVYDRKVWAETFGAAPIDNKKLAARGGLPMAQGRHAAASLFEEGPQVMRSRPFLIDHEHLSFTVFDFGDGRTRIALEVGGENVCAYQGRGQGEIGLVKWDLSSQQGRQAVLVVHDDAAAAEIGIGIDSIFLHDE